MADGLYNTAKLRMWAGATGEIDLIADTIKWVALENDTGEDLDDEFIGEVVSAGAVVVTSTGHTHTFGGDGRIALASKAIAVDQVNNRAEFDCANTTWSSVVRNGSESWVALLIVKEITNDAASPVIGHIDSFTAVIPNGSDITYTVDAEGLIHNT